MTKINHTRLGLKAYSWTDLLCNHISWLMSGKFPQVHINNIVAAFAGWNDSKAFSILKKTSQAIVKATANDVKHPGSFLTKFKEEFSGENWFEKQYKPLMFFITHVSIYVEKYPSEKMKILTGLMNLHSVFIPKSKPTKSQMQEIKSHILSEIPEISNKLLEEFRDTCKAFVSQMYTEIDNVDLIINPLYHFTANDKKSFDAVSGKVYSRRYPILYDIGRILSDSRVMKVYKTNPQMFLYYTFGINLKEFIFAPEVERSVKEYPHSGAVSLLPSIKMKYRPIAVPGLIWLSLSYPLSHVLQQLGKVLPNHGMYDHDQAAQDVRTRIEKSNQIYSIDYSNFTDHFPYKLQRVLLEELKNEDIISDFDLLVQDNVVSLPYKFGNDIVRYSVGTPQGTPPSFPLASICHMLIGHMCHKRVTGNYDFFSEIPIIVVGDDAAIFSTPLFNEVSKVMDELNVPIQTNKTLVSSHVAEFCSKFITKDGVYLMKKIQPIDNRDSFIKNFRYYDGNMDIPKKWENILYLRDPFGILDASEDNLLSDILDFQSNISACRRSQQILLKAKDYWLIMVRRDTFKKCFSDISYDYEPSRLMENYNPLVRFSKDLSQYKNVVDANYFSQKHLITEFSKQLTSGELKYSPLLKEIVDFYSRVTLKGTTEELQGVLDRFFGDKAPTVAIDNKPQNDKIDISVPKGGYGDFGV